MLLAKTCASDSGLNFIIADFSSFWTFVLSIDVIATSAELVKLVTALMVLCSAEAAGASLTDLFVY